MTTPRPSSQKSTQRDVEHVAGEFSWGPGLTPPELADAPPSEGGLYRGKSPAAQENTGLRALVDELAERHRRPR